MKFIKQILIIIVFLLGITVSAETLTAGVSKVEMVPNSFYGSWRVIAKIDKQSSNGVYFKPQTVDLWNLSREGDVINLNNPFTGASASVTVDYVDGNIIRFTKTGEYDNKKLTDTVDLKLNGDTFTGINSLTLETFSIRDKSLIKKDTATYVLRGEKISGSSITGK
ncbi:unknown [Clostridium sp. CAG:967]|nr:unknown [Clostridium sp. CAG:967]